MSRTVITCGLLVDGSGEPPRRDIAVTVRGEYVVRVEPLAAADLSGALVVRAPGATLTPGLVDAHTHPGWTGDPDGRAWRTCTARTGGGVGWVLGALHAALRAGVTTVRDCGSPFASTAPARAVVDAGVLPGAHVVVGGPCITTTAGHAAAFGVSADSPFGCRNRVRELCAAGAEVIKVMASGGDLDPETNRRRPQFTTRELRAVVTEAHRLGRTVVAHATCTDAIERAVAAGVDVIAHCNWLAAAEDDIDYRPGVADAIVAAGLALDLDLPNSVADYAERDGSRARFEGWSPAPRSRWELHAALRERGVPIMLTSDAFGEELDALPARLASAHERLGLPIEEAIAHVTAIPAGLVCAERAVGLVAPGRRADLALFAGDLSADVGGLRRCLTAWRDGRPTPGNATAGGAA